MPLSALRFARRPTTALVVAALAACSDAATSPVTPPKTVIDPSALQVGDHVSLNVNTQSACDRTASGIRVGRVAAVGAHAVIVADTSNPAGGFTDADYQNFAAAFDTLVYPVDVRHFGPPADAVSGGRALVFYTSAVNALTPPNADYYIGGFFWARDLFPTTGTNACAGSNASEMFYMLVPDPSGAVNGNARAKDFVARSSISVLGHEFQHLINASRRLYTLDTGNYLEELWLNEGLSHIAEELDFYRASGLAPLGEPGQSPRARLTPAAIEALPDGLAALNGYGVQNLARLGLYLKATEQYGPYVPETASGATTTYDYLEMRGAIWSFLRYAADRSGKTDSAFFQPLVNSTQTGLANLQTATGLGAALADWMRDWAISTYADGVVPAADGRYRQASWDFRSVLTGFALQGGGRINGGVYPLATRALSDAKAQTFTLRGGTSAYLEFTVPAGAQATLRTQTGSGALPSTLRVSVVAPGAATADAAVVNADAGAGGATTVTNAESTTARYALVLFDADPDYNTTRSVTVTGTGLAAAPTPLAASDAVVAGPTQARLAAGAAEPLVTDAPVLARLHAIARRELAPRVEAARAALRVQRLPGPAVLPRR
ncbi:hypothetical protein tb265_12480 [Gemmatimonadetes bacterium T265]|nr:hypothetical protein tb265_12480 [Gemmatimonadetes bacterium T265]